MSDLQGLQDLQEMVDAWQAAVERLRCAAAEEGRSDIDFDNLPPIYFSTFVIGYKSGWRAAERAAE